MLILADESLADEPAGIRAAVHPGLLSFVAVDDELLGDVLAFAGHQEVLHKVLQIFHVDVLLRPLHLRGDPLRDVRGQSNVYP